MAAQAWREPVENQKTLILKSMASPQKLLLRILVPFLLAGTVLLVYSARGDLKPPVTRFLAGESQWFSADTPPMRSIPHIFDLGIVDADSDGRLDLFTSNHNYRQILLLSNAEGRDRDVLTEWGLDQNREYPGWEQSFSAPTIDQPGLYVYWLGETLMLRTSGLKALGPAAGAIRMFSEIQVDKNEGFALREESQKAPDSSVAQRIVRFTAEHDGQLALLPLSRGVPTEIEIDPAFPLDSVFIGPQKISPKTHALAPLLRDRHGHAWADINADGKLDVYISRGGVGGTIRKLPAVVRERIRDEMLLTGGRPHFRDAGVELGIEKKDCSGRHSEWVDFDHDGRLDLFVNCQDRGKSEGVFPKQLWRQLPDGRFQDVAIEVGLGLPDNELIDFVWMDADGDGQVDLLTTEDTGFFLYRNKGGQFTPQFLFRPDFVRADVADLKGEVNNYWRFDGKLTVADIDADGDLDVFSASKRGSLLLVNEGDTFRRVDPSSVGLPAQNLNATWVDYDNDGLPDLHTVPDGLYRQTPQGRFEATGLLALPANKYHAAIVHWYDRDNNGTRDILMALNENHSLWRWWQKPFKTWDDRFVWVVETYRNLAKENHWLQMELSGPAGNKQAIGARVTVTTTQGTQVQEVGSNDSSFFSQGHYRLYFGLGSHARVDRITVQWSDGHRQELTGVPADRLLAIEYKRTPEQ